VGVVTDPCDVTIATYQASAQDYAEQTQRPSAAVVRFYDALADRVGTGQVLEVGSGPGRAAGYLEARGVLVERTDVTPAFVEMQRAAGHQARLLDVRTDGLGGPYAAILADAVLLHLDRVQFADVLARMRSAVTDEGILAVTLKEGDGAGWTTAKLGRPRHYTFWREQQLRDVLARTGWAVLSLEHVQGRVDPWLYLLATTARSPAEEIDRGGMMPGR
jgi:SAM-dependent methyltransferase